MFKKATFKAKEQCVQTGNDTQSTVMVQQERRKQYGSEGRQYRNMKYKPWTTCILTARIHLPQL